MQSFVADRLACVDLPAFSLQILLKRYPEWRHFPVAVVSREVPQAEVLRVSRSARKKGVSPGMSFAAAMGLCPELRAKAVSEEDMVQSKKEVMEYLRSFSPKVASDQGGDQSSGAFWLNAEGLERLYPCLEGWAQEIRKKIGQAGFNVVVIVGFSRLSTLALARSGDHHTLVLPSPEAEAIAVRAVSLACLGLPPETSGELQKLGKHTVGDLLHLPADGVLERYGPVVHQLRSVAAGTFRVPMVSELPDEPCCVSLLFDLPETDAIRLTFYVKRILRKLLSQIADRYEALESLDVHLFMDQGGRIVTSVRPATPTLDEGQLIDLVRLRLDNTVLDSGVEGIALHASTVRATMTQRRLFQKHFRRNLAAADKALARVRAEFGPESVVFLKAQEGHLPEAQFSFEPLERVKMPEVICHKERMLIRRIFVRPRPIAVHSVGYSKKFCVADGAKGFFYNIRGPYILSGGWWHQEIHREYYFAQNDKGRVLWIYRDRKRARWYLHGEVS
jgi:protein ImuB